MRRVFRAALVAVLAAVLLVPAAAAADESPVPPGWRSIGPTGPGAAPTTVLAVSPAWPADPLLLALREGTGMVRTRDAGQRWEFLPTPEVFRALTLAPAAAGPPLAFAVAWQPPDLLGADRTIYRSATAGDDWQLVLTLPRGSRPTFTFSPAFARDGIAFLRGGSLLLRSADAGLTWTELTVSGQLRLSPTFSQDGLAFVLGNGGAQRSRDHGQTWEDAGIAPDQNVTDLQFSPTFAADSLLFAVARASLPPSPGQQRDIDDSASSYGVLRSIDGGASWSPAVDGLEVGGLPYRAVQALLTSPTYAQDQTLMAFALGPRTVNRPGTQVYGWGLFRTTDAGATWQRVWSAPGYPDRTARNSLALSPAFAQDGLILRTTVEGLVVGRASGCTLQQSRDGGATWAVIRVPSAGLYWSCGGPELLGAPGQIAGRIRIGGEGGATIRVWNATADTPSTLDGVSSPVTMSPLAAADGTVFTTVESRGVFVFGPSAAPAAGSVSCPAQTVRGFERVYAASDEVRASLGCALEPEQPVRIHESGPDAQRGVNQSYLVEAFPSSWYSLESCARSAASCSERPTGFYRVEAAADKPFPTEQERVYDGVAQRFERGMMLFTPRPDGSRTIVVLGGSAGIESRPTVSSWFSFPDP